jgi:ribosome biogenesis GTPase
MAPKFRGGSEDWLDSKKTGSRSSSRERKIKKSGHAAALDPAEANATIAEVFPGSARVRFDESGNEILCKYRRAQVWGHAREALLRHVTDDKEREKLEKTRERAPVAVGDRVKASRIGGPLAKEGVIEAVCERRNFLVRPAPARDETMLHSLAANLDAVVIVASVRNPEFTPGLVDRFLIAAQQQEIEPILCVNKIDLLDAEASRPWSVYSDLGITVVEVCAKTGSGIELLAPRISRKVAVFCGKSGVGKTSILRKLTGREELRVGEVSDATGKGQHTTTSAILLDSGADRPWIDTPGVREFGLYGIASHQLRHYFPELQRAGCEDPDCRHTEAEDGCRARGLLRHESYLRILNSLEAGEH